MYCDMSLCLPYSMCNGIKKKTFRMFFLHIAIKKCCLLSARFEVCLATSTRQGFLKSGDFNSFSLGIFPCEQTLDLLLEDKKSMKRGLGSIHLPAELPVAQSLEDTTCCRQKNNSLEHGYSVWAQMWSKCNACCSHYGFWCWACSSRQGSHS